MYSGTRFVAVNALLAVAASVYPLQSLADICGDLVTARMAAASVPSAQALSDAIDRAKAQVAATKTRLASAEAAEGKAKAHLDAAMGRYRAAMDTLTVARANSGWRESSPLDYMAPEQRPQMPDFDRRYKELEAATTEAKRARLGREAATERLNETIRARLSAQTAYDNAQSVLKQAETQRGSSGNAARDAEERVKQLAQQLEATFRGLLQIAASQAVDAQLQSTTQGECSERLSRAETSYAQLKAFARANAVCLQPGHLQEISLLSDRARNVRAECNRMSADTRRGDAGGGFESSGATTDVASQTAAAGASAAPGNVQVRNVEAAINSCNFDRALASLNLYRPADPNDPWMAAKYQQVHENRERVAAVERLLAQIRGILANSPSPDAMRYAVELARTAISVAPDCMSGAISSIRPVLASAITASAKADSQRSRDAMARVLDSISRVAQDINNRQRGGPDVTSGSAGAGGVESWPAAGQSSGGGGGGFESAGGSSGGGGSGNGARSGASAAQPAPAGSQTPPRPAPRQPAAQNATGCRWVKEGMIFGQIVDNIECQCNGRKASDNNCTGPRPR